MEFRLVTRVDLEPQRRQRDHAPQQFDRELMDALLDFERRDLRTVTPTDWEALRRTLERFDGYRASGVVPSAKGRSATRTRARRSLRQTELRTMQATLRQVFGELRPLHPERAQSMPYPCLPLTVSEVRLGTSPDFASRIYRVDVATWPDTFWLSVVRLLERRGDRLRRCLAPLGSTRCGRLFIKTGRGEYCSTKCRDRARSRRWYHDNLERARTRRRRAHQQKVRKATGPNVTTERRTPSAQ